MDRAAWIESLQPAGAPPVLLRTAPGRPTSAHPPDPWATAAYVRQQVPAAHLVDTHGARREGDWLLCLGRSLGSPCPGDETAVAATLAGRGVPIVVCVGDRTAPREAADRLAGLAPRIQWVHLAWPETALARAAPADPAHAALMALPRGLPDRVGPHGTPTRPSDRARTALRAPVACRPPPLAAVLVGELLHDALRLAEDVPLPSDTTLADLFALHWLTEHHPAPDVAARAGTAAARIRLAWGQPSIAQATLHGCRAALGPDSAALHARLDQAEGDVLAHVGELDAAARAHDQAAARLGDARHARLLLRFTRRRAEGLLARGCPDLARPHLHTARALARELGEPLALSATLRASGDAAAAAGEQLGAEALYEQACATPVPSGERINSLLGEIGLALRQGEVQQAGLLLSRIPPARHGLSRAGVLHRAAEHALRTRDLERAARTAASAAESFARAGSPIGQARATRLLGDVRATAGDTRSALRHYAVALDLQVRVRDLAGARRTLHHGVRLVECAGDPTLARRLRALAGDG